MRRDYEYIKRWFTRYQLGLIPRVALVAAIRCWQLDHSVYTSDSHGV